MAAGIEARLQELGIVSPELPAPGGNYVPAKTVGSVAMHLRLSQVVNEPMFTVSAALPKHVLPLRRLF